jgi:protein-S-isoprenylcysteine O-methyltransferase Ste14
MTIAFGLQRFFGDIRYHRERYRQFLGVAFIVLISFAGQPQFPMYWIGAVMVVAGVAIRLWASGHVKKDKVLATDGPYAYVRHPLYVGNLILLFGFSLASGLWWSFPVLIVFLLKGAMGNVVQGNTCAYPGAPEEPEPCFWQVVIQAEPSPER